MVRVHEINGGGPSNKLLGSRKSMAGSQDTNGWSTGNKLLEPRIQMVGVQENTC